MTQEKLGPEECTVALEDFCKKAFTGAVGHQEGGFEPASGKMTLQATGIEPAGATLNEGMTQEAPMVNPAKLDM
jgi:hypothetical protein